MAVYVAFRRRIFLLITSIPVLDSRASGTGIDDVQACVLARKRHLLFADIKLLAKYTFPKSDAKVR